MKRETRSFWRILALGMFAVCGSAPTAYGRLVCSWQFDDPANPLYDSTGNGYDAVACSGTKSSTAVGGLGNCYLLSASGVTADGVTVENDAKTMFAKLAPGDGAIAIPVGAHLRLPFPSYLRNHPWTMRIRFCRPNVVDGAFSSFFQRKSNNSDDADLFIRSRRSGSTSERVGGGWSSTLGSANGSGYGGPVVTRNVWHELVLTQGNNRSNISLDGSTLNYSNTALSTKDFFGACDQNYFLLSADDNKEDTLMFFSRVEIYDEGGATDVLRPGSSLDTTCGMLTGEWCFPAGNPLKANVGRDLEYYTRTGSRNITQVPGLVPGDGAMRAGRNNGFKVWHGVGPNSPYSIVLDIKLPANCGTASGNFHALFNHYKNNEGDARMFLRWYGANDVRVYYSTGKYSGGYPQDVWHRYVCTWDGTTKCVYWDGVRLVSTTDGGASLGGDTGFLLSDENGEDWPIDITYAAFYANAITQSDVSAFHSHPLAHDAQGRVLPQAAPTGIWTPTGTETAGTAAPVVFGVPFIANGNGYTTSRTTAPAKETFTALFDYQLPSAREKGAILLSNPGGHCVGVYASASALNGSISSTSKSEMFETSAWDGALFSHWTFTPVSENEWHRLAVVRSPGAGTMTYYIDGRSCPQVSFTGLGGANDFKPAAVMTYLENAGANIQRVATYDVALLPPEIASLGGAGSNDWPVASAAAPTLALTANHNVATALIDRVTFTLAYADEDGDAGNVSIDYGDGTGDVKTGVASGSTVTFDHVYSSGGAITATARAIDLSGRVCTLAPTVPVNSLLVQLKSEDLLTAFPWQQNVYTNRFSVMCETALECVALNLQWGEGYTNTTPFVRSPSAAGRWVYTAHVAVDGQEGATIPYRLAVGDMPLVGASTERTVRLWNSAATDGDFTAVVWGDNQQGGKAGDWDADKYAYVSALFEHAMARHPDFGISTGDMSSSADYASQIRPLLLERTNPILGATIPYYTAFGNHDTSYVENRRYFENPSVDDPAYGTPDAGNFYLYRGEVLLVFIDNKVQSAAETKTWLEAVLSTARAQAAKFRLVFAHVPVYLELWGGNNFTGLKDLYNKYHVDMVFSGHMHGYERIEYPGDTFVQLTNGGAGYLDHVENVNANYGDATKLGGHNPVPYLWARQTLDKSALGSADPVRAGLVQSYGELKVAGNTLTYTAHGFDANGAYIGVFDCFSLTARGSWTGAVEHVEPAAVPVPETAAPAGLIDAAAFTAVGAPGVTSIHGTLGGAVQLATAPITKAQWAAVEAARGRAAEVPESEADAPATGMTRREAEAFIAWVNGGATTYRLPTEAELATLFFYDAADQKWRERCAPGLVSEWTSTVEPVTGWCRIMGGNARAQESTWSSLRDRPAIATPACSANYLGFRLAKTAGTVAEPQPPQGTMMTDLQQNLVLQGRIEGNPAADQKGTAITSNGQITFRSVSFTGGIINVSASDRLLHIAGDNDLSMTDLYLDNTTITGVVCAAGVTQASITFRSVRQYSTNVGLTFGEGVTFRTLGDFTTPGTDTNQNSAHPTVVDGVFDVGGTYMTTADTYIYMVGKGDFRAARLSWYANMWFTFGNGTLTFTSESPFTKTVTKDRSYFITYGNPVTVRGTVDWTMPFADYSGQQIQLPQTTVYRNAEHVQGWVVDTLDPDDGTTAHTFTMTPAKIEGAQFLTKVNPGVLRFGGRSYNYTGDTRLEGGTLELLPGTAFAGSSVSAKQGATLAMSGTITFAKPVTFAGNTLRLSGETVLTGAVTGPYILDQAAGATLVLTRGSTLTGAATLAEGTSKVRLGFRFNGADPMGEYVLLRGAGLTMDQLEFAGTDLEDPTLYDFNLSVTAANEVVLRVLPAGSRVAEWTGEGAVGNLADPANWRVVDASGAVLAGAVPDAQTFVHVTGATTMNLPKGGHLSCAGILLTDGAYLDADCDWRAVDFSLLRLVGTLDLRGHNLSVASQSGTPFDFTITDSTPITETTAGGELHFEVEAGTTVINTALALTGSLTFVKDGAGTLEARKQNQTYAGGTRIAAGTMMLTLSGSTSTTYAFKYRQFGAQNTPIIVEAGAALDTKGNYDLAGHQLVLNGGTLRNTGCDMSYGVANGWAANGNTALTANSTISINFHTRQTAGVIDLQGHKLDLGIASGKTFFLEGASVFSNGFVNVTSGGWFQPRSTEKDMRTVDFRFNCALNIETNISVRSLEMVYNADWAAGAGRVDIYGTYKATVDYGRNFVLQDGALLDLSGRTTPFNTKSSLASCSALTFATNATVRVALGTRRLGSLEKIVDWTVAGTPVNLSTLTFRLADRRGSLLAKDDGLYYQGGLCVILR